MPLGSRWAVTPRAPLDATVEDGANSRRARHRSARSRCGRRASAPTANVRTSYSSVVSLDATVLDDVEPGELEFPFGAGSLALDFLATVGERWRRRFERLRTPDDLVGWLARANLASRRMTASERDLEDARRLRSAIFDCVTARKDGRRAPRIAVAVLNGFAGEDAPAPRLTERWHRETSADHVRASLAAVARDAVDVLSTEDPRRLRECAADDCSRLFLDRSRPGVRRWCDAAGCGNRAKTAAYRRRRRKRLDDPTA
jgi:predicted RNA-binding Zn ribbon-like protein